MEPTRNLLIIHTPGAEALSDWTTVKEMIGARTPDIDVRIASNSELDQIQRGWKARPLLVLALHALPRPWSGGGKLYTGIDYDKVVQGERLAAAGLPTPRTRRLTDLSSLNTSGWGEFVIVKPAVAHLGEGIRLLRTSEISGLVDKLTEVQRRGMILQAYVDHADLGGRPFEFRVLAFFGELIYAARNRWPVARASLSRIAASRRGLIASNSTAMGRRVRTLTDDVHVIRLGLAAARTFPELPCVAVDIIRERSTGNLFILEVNPKGESWHLSSDFAIRTFDPDHRAALYAQCDALNVVANGLIEKTRAEAC